MIGIIVPSRGLIHSRTVEFLFKMFAAADDGGITIYFSHNRPIPECYNIPVQKALEDNHDWIMIIEEDILPNDKALLEIATALVDDEFDIAAADYKLRNGEKCFSKVNDVLIGGLGLVMMRSNVAKKLFPLRTNVSYSLPKLELFEAAPNTYGQHDIDFWVRANTEGFKVKLVRDVDHLNVETPGKENTNNGVHEIEVL